VPRAIWTGSIAFGLVNVPIGLYSATESKTIHFHQLQRKTNRRIRNKRVAEGTGREVDYEDIVKGYETDGGDLIVVTPEELESVEPGRTRSIEIEDFVDLDDIDPVYYDKTYYLAPKGDATKPYALLRDAMASSAKVAIGRFVMRTKQYLVAIRPVDDVLVLQTMYFGDEVRTTDELDVPGKVKLTPKEKKIAQQLIDSLAVDFDPMAALEASLDDIRTARRNRGLEKLSKEELAARAKEAEIQGRSKMSKTQLIDALREAS